MTRSPMSSMGYLGRATGPDDAAGSARRHSVRDDTRCLRRPWHNEYYNWVADSPRATTPSKRWRSEGESSTTLPVRMAASSCCRKAGLSAIQVRFVAYYRAFLEFLDSVESPVDDGVGAASHLIFFRFHCCSLFVVVLSVLGSRPVWRDALRLNRVPRASGPC